MKIYFIASITGKKYYRENYQLVVDILKSLGHKLIFNDLFKRDAEEVWNQDKEKNKKFYNFLQNCIRKCDIMVAEVSYPSISNGFEIASILNAGKPVLVLYSTERPVPVLDGIESEQLVVEKYDLENAKKTIKNSLDYIKEKIDTRFTMLMSAEIVSFLDEIAKKRKIPRSVYIRSLIKKDMVKKN